MSNNISTECVPYPNADSSSDLVTHDEKRLLLIINVVIICGIVSLFGIGSNIINICVFYKQGFKDSINISLIGLAISDFSSSVTMFWTSICDNPLFIDLDLPFDVLDVMYVTAGFPHICFNRITSFITAFITLERCLCIAMPLKIKNIITPFRTKIINVSIFISMITLFSPFFFVNKLEWKHSIARNRSLLVHTVTPEREIVESVTFAIHSLFMSTIFLLSVTTCTIILVVKLNQKTKWREASANPTTSNAVSASVKDKKVVKMITIISTMFIICYTPPTINFLAMIIFPEFSFTGRYQNTLYASWSVAFVLAAINSSVNIFVYFKMSSKFKATLCDIFCEVPK